MAAPLSLKAVQQRLFLLPCILLITLCGAGSAETISEFSSGLTLTVSEAGWYAVLRVPVTRSDEELVIELLREKSVLVHPGHFYDFPSDGYLVLSLITPEAEFAEGIALVMENSNS